MLWRTVAFALIVVLLLIQIFVSAGVLGGAWSANMAAAGVAIPVLVLFSAGVLYWDRQGEHAAPTYSELKSM